MASADFGLMDYNISGNGLYQTWVYQMSPAGGGFTFTSAAGPSQVANPCYQINTALGNPASVGCNTLTAYYAP